MATTAIPLDTRYVPFVQQPYCCVPACLQTILYKNGIPLLSQEQIGAELGLVVPLDMKHVFFNVEARKKPAANSGFGTRIQDPNFSLEALLSKSQWPFDLEIELSGKFSSQDEFISRLGELVEADNDVMICFQNDSGAGHVCVLDTIDDESVRVIDPAATFPKWRTLSHGDIFEHVKAHGDDNYGGLWILTRR